mgnify:FL=1
MIASGKSPEQIADEKGMLIVNDMSRAAETIEEILSANKQAVEQYVSGEIKVFGFLMGQCSKKLKGVCTPKAIKELLEKKLKSLSDKPVSNQSDNNNDKSEEDIKIGLKAYENPKAYKPSSSNNIMQISPDKLKKEFELSDALSNIGKDITIDCCVYKIRNMSEFSFIVVRTGRYLLQTIYSGENCTDSIDGLKEGFFVNITGTVTENEKGYNGIEIILKSISLISNPAEEYPLHVPNRRLGCTLDINLNNRSVALRNAYERAIFKLQEGVCNGFREFMLSLIHISEPTRRS